MSTATIFRESTVPETASSPRSLWRIPSQKKTITLTDEMADASIGMEMNTYTIGSGMSGENLLEKDYAVMNLDTHQRIELGWISRRDHELSNFGKRFLTLLAEKLNSMQLD